jgi:hypothetical protein
MFEHHPMFGCRNASSLLCSLGLPKFNKISVFWMFARFRRSPLAQKTRFSHSFTGGLWPGRHRYGWPGKTWLLNLRKRSGNEGVSATSATPRVDKEHYILAAL